MQVAERVLGHQGLAVNAHAADGLGHPSRVAAKQLIVLGRAQVTHQTQLDDELVDELLCTGFVQNARVQIALNVDIQEGRRTAERGRRAVVLLDAGQICHIQKLHRLVRVLCRLGQVDPVARRHGLDLAQCANLLGNLLAQADSFLVHRAVNRLEIVLLFLDQAVNAVQRDAAIVADDAAAAIGIGQTGQQTDMTGNTGALGVGVKDTFVVGLAVLGEVALDGRVELVAVLLERRLCHAHAAVQVYNAL